MERRRLTWSTMICAIAVVLPAQGPPVNTILVILSVISRSVLLHKKKAKDTHNLPPPQPFHPKRCENLCKPNAMKTRYQWLRCSQVYPKLVQAERHENTLSMAEVQPSLSKTCASRMKTTLLNISRLREAYLIRHLSIIAKSMTSSFVMSSPSFMGFIFL